MDPRDSTRETRKKSRWVQDLIKEKEEETTSEGMVHLEGRNQGVLVSKKSFTTVSSVPETKPYAGNAQTLKKKEESIHLEVELAEKLNEIQKSIADSQTRQTKMLNQILSLLTDYISNDVRRIANLEAENRYNKKVIEDMDQIKASLKTYKTLFWGFVAALIISIMVYLMRT